MLQNKFNFYVDMFMSFNPLHDATRNEFVVVLWIWNFFIYICMCDHVCTHEANCVTKFISLWNLSPLWKHASTQVKHNFNAVILGENSGLDCLDCYCYESPKKRWDIFPKLSPRIFSKALRCFLAETFCLHLQ